VTQSVTPRGVEPFRSPDWPADRVATQFAVLASGSRGNSTLIRGGCPGVLIDVGIGPRDLRSRLQSVGASWSEVAAVVLTHTHGDHIDSATFAEVARRRLSLHCHEGHRTTLTRDPGFQRLEAAGLVSCYDEDRPFLTATGVRLEPIPVPHDGGPTFGFRIEVSCARRTRPVSIGYLADSGCWSEQMADALADVDVLGVEFNHDVGMQKSSGRPWVLIRRNLGDRGHLSNHQGAEFVEAVLKRSRRGALQHLVLLHLSQQCNQPELAIEAAQSAVRHAGRRVNVHAAQQSPAHPNLWVRPGRKTAQTIASRSRLRSQPMGPALGSVPPILAGLFDDDDRPGDQVGAP
jgi:phosphoribosyl 1,2-cyclic phosphodiesterase